ncbi:MAG: arsenate reductase ArsC [Desulfobacterales bacterium]|jgi:arsenate reductase|nr:arsenate reductase ArsC [Desulfobacterales bacterium]
MAEAFLRKYGGEKVNVESAGFEPAERVNPLVVEVMQEEGIDLSAKKPQSVFGLYRQGRLFDHVITVCSDSEGECPVFPGITRRWHIPFPDPAAAEGTQEEKLAKVREIRDAIRAMILHPPEGEFDFRKLSG